MGATLLDETDYAGAEQLYARIRQDTTDVEKIAKNTGFHTKYIHRIKTHVFHQEHLLDRYRDMADPPRFDASPLMANSWLRLAEGTQTQVDIALLKHELAEAWYRPLGPSYKDAHDKASLKYPSPY